MQTIAATTLASSSDSSEDSSDDDRPYDPEQHRAKKKELAKVDHSTMQYGAFRKAFYIEVPEIKNMTDEEVEAYKKEMDGIKVRGKRCPRPIKRWTQCGLSDKVAHHQPRPVRAIACAVRAVRVAPPLHRLRCRDAV